MSGACQPASACTDVHGCRAGTVCDLASRTCVECLGSADCASGESCVGQRCLAGCTASGACPAGLHCDSLVGLCLQCATAADCADSEYCSAGACVLDTCVAGATTCDATGQAVQMCSAVGDRVVPIYCGKQASCVGEPGQGSCTDWVCKPGISACNAAGQLEVCAQDGLSVEETVDCPATQQTCVASKCVDVVCDPGSISCDVAANSLHVCASNGTSDSVTKCAAGQFCDAETKACQVQVCTPNVESCLDGKHAVCNDVGSGYASQTACKANQACVLGACAPIICTTTKRYCADDGNVHDCDATGTVSTLSQTCQAPGEQDAGGVGGAGPDYSQHCEEQGGSAACYTDPCVKGRKYCGENQVKTCNAQGTGPVAGGTDCGADAVCLNDPAPHCAPKICEPNTRFCNATGDVELCSADGTSSYLYYDCTAGDYCDEGIALCQPQTCTPGAAGCNGSLATTCNADGSAWVAGGTDCALTNKVCEAGSCKPKVCGPNEYFCKSGNVNYCNATGTAGTLTATCTAAEYCSPGYYACLPDQCTAGSPVCVDMQHLASCKADGSGPNGAGTTCGANKTCDAGACKSQVCTPDSSFCDGGHVQQCDSTGLVFSQKTYCFADEYCKASGALASCEKKVCITGAKGCSGESYGTCDALGSGYTESPTSCTATSKLCSLTGCATSAIDVIGDQSTNGFSSGSYFMGDVIYVRTQRKLTQLELDSFSDLSGQSLHWAIYSSLTEGGPYVPVFDSFAPGAAAGFQSSGAISVTLAAGRYYVIGMRAQSGLFVYRKDGLTPPMSFADQLGTMLEYADPGMLPPTFSEGTLGGSWHMRLTTVLP